MKKQVMALMLLVTGAFALYAFQAKPEEQKGSIEGRVTNSATGEPLRRVSLALSGAGRVTAETDEDGRFAFQGVDPGRYTLTADRAGYAKQVYGARGSSTSGTPLVLAAGQQLKDILFKLAPAAAILGKVLDEDSEPVAGAVVLVARTLYRNGEAQLAAGGTAVTNELGEYRVGGLASGTYVVSASIRTVGSGLAGSKSRPAAGGPERDYVTTYYPRSVDPSAAAPVQLMPGGEAGGTNIWLAKADTFRVRGRVSGSSEGAQTVVMAAPKSGSKSLTGITRARSAVAQADGTFEIAGVTPGAYTLISASGDMISGMLFASQDVQVGKENVSGVLLELQRGGEVTGSVVVDGSAAASLRDLKVTLAVAPDAVNLSSPTALVSDDGTFSVKNVTPARYHVQLTGGADNAYVKSVHLGTQIVPEDGFDFAGGTAGPLEVRLSLAGAQVAGVVLDAEDKPCANATVVLMPDSRRFSLYKEEPTDASGNFVFKGVAPGQYKAAAWDDIETVAYKDAGYLEKVAGRLVTVSLKEDDNTRVSLKVIPSPVQ